MAKAVINLQKESGGIVKISPVDGIGVTEVTVPESGELVTKDYVDDTKVSKPESINITGTAIFNGTTQNINLTNIGNITLAIGDVIEVSGTISNNKLFTVESIVDNNNIVVNYEHRGTSTPVPKGRLINETASSCTIKLYNRAKDALLGQGQYWCTPATARAINTTYTNNTNRTIVAHVDTSADTQFFIDDLSMGYSNAAGVPFVVPSWSNYRLASALQAWNELR